MQQQQQQQGRAALSSARASQLNALQALLGYTFRCVRGSGLLAEQTRYLSVVCAMTHPPFPPPSNLQQASSKVSKFESQPDKPPPKPCPPLRCFPRDITLLDQACTHDPSGTCPSYRELAFVGDAALWLLFAEHAVRSYGCAGEDPVR